MHSTCARRSRFITGVYTVGKCASRLEVFRRSPEPPSGAAAAFRDHDLSNYAAEACDGGVELHFAVALNRCSLQARSFQ